MSDQKITQSALLKAVLVFISLGALILGLIMFFYLPEFIGNAPYRHQERNLESSVYLMPGKKNAYIPDKEDSKRAPIYFDTHAK